MSEQLNELENNQFTEESDREDVEFYIDYNALRTARGAYKRANVLNYIRLGGACEGLPHYRLTPTGKLYYKRTDTRTEFQKAAIKGPDGEKYFNLVYLRKGGKVKVGLLMAVIFLNRGVYDENMHAVYKDGNPDNIDIDNIDYITIVKPPSKDRYFLTVENLMRRFIRSAYVKYKENKPFLESPEEFRVLADDPVYKYKFMRYITNNTVIELGDRDDFLRAFYNKYLTPAPCEG